MVLSLWFVTLPIHTDPKVQFAAGQTVAQIALTIKADGVAENDEEITLILTDVELMESSQSADNAILGMLTREC